MIAIIDDGVHMGVYDEVFELAFDLEVCDGEVVKRSCKDAFASHGTTVAAIIKAYAPRIQIGSIKAMDFCENGAIRDFVTAIDWCCEHQIKLVNLSNGTTDFMDFDLIADCIKRTNQKTWLVAAQDNTGKYTFPAQLHGVVGVCYDRKLVQNSIRVSVDSENDIGIFGNLKLEVRQGGEMKQLPTCNSYETAAITGLLAATENQQDTVARDLRQCEKLLEKNAFDISVEKKRGRTVVSPCTEVLIPIILLERMPSDKTAGDIVHHIARLFRENGSFATVLTEDCSAIQLLTDRLEENMDLREQMQSCIKKYNSDLLLLDLCSVHSKIDVHEDLRVVLSPDGQYVYDENGMLCTEFRWGDSVEEMAAVLFQYLSNLFEVNAVE